MTDDEPDPGRQPEAYPESTGGLLLLALLLAALGTTALLAILALGALVLALVFSLFENSLQHHSHARLMAAAKKSGREDALHAALRHEDELLFASKLGRALAQVAGVALVVICLARAGLEPFALALWTIGLAIAFLIANVAGPYLLGRGAGHVILLRGLAPYSRCMLVLRAPVSLLQRVASRLTGASVEQEEIGEELASVLEEGTREGTLAETEKEMIEGVMDLREVTVEHVMTPRTELIALQVDSTVREAIDKSLERGLSRLPVYGDTPDDVLGVLYVKDLLAPLARGEEPSIRSVMRRPFFVPETKNVGELLAEMKASQIHLAIVLDEYGGTAGVVSIEDILEEIVGEIADEHESATPSDVVRMGDNAATVEGRAHIDDLNDALDLDLPESEEYETVGGLLFSRMGRVPEPGESYEIDGVRFTVLDADERRIHRIKVTVRHSA